MTVLSGINTWSPLLPTRHRVRFLLCVVALSLLLSAISGCGVSVPTGSGTYAGYSRHTRDIVGLFNTVISIIAYCESPEDFERLVETAETRFEELHAMYDIYEHHAGFTNLYDVNAAAGSAALPVSAEILDLLTFCKDETARMGNKVDISLGVLLALWSDAREAGRNDPDRAALPDMAVLREAKKHSGLDKLEINPEAGTVRISDPAVRLDVGAVAKGFATRIVRDELAAAGWNSFLISNGSSSIVLHGRPFQDGKETWTVGIQNPSALLPGPGEIAEDQPDYLAVAHLKDRAVGNSGDYQNYYFVNGVSYHHLIDPDTLMPATRFRGVSVFTEDCAMADLLSSTLFLLSYEDGRALVDSIPDTDAIWIYPEGRAVSTPGIAPLLTDIRFVEGQP